jgi:glycerol uptake facilitator-like aquaporin
MGPYFIGFTVSLLISIFAPLTQAGWNPARDFGPRLFSYFIGFKKIAIPAPRNGIRFSEKFKKKKKKIIIQVFGFILSVLL